MTLSGKSESPYPLPREKTYRVVSHYNDGDHIIEGYFDSEDKAAAAVQRVGRLREDQDEMPRIEVEALMPVSEHLEIVASLNQSEPGSAYFTSPAMKRLADEHERLREAALVVVEFVESRPGWQLPLLRALVADLRSVLSPVNPQED